MSTVIKRNIYTMVIDHDETEQGTNDAIEGLVEIHKVLRELGNKTTIHRADNDLDLWEDVSDLYDDAS